MVLLFMSPWIIGFFAFYLYPMVATLYFSFTHYDLLSQPIWVGFDNYRYMFTQDPFFWQAVRNTLWIVVIGVPVQIVFACRSLGCSRDPSGAVGVYRSIFFLPYMVPVVAASLGFVFLLNPSGPVNRILGALHLPQPLVVPGSAVREARPGAPQPVAVGDLMIIFLAGLLDVPAHLYEAADIEGASGWQKFRHITLPTISPVLFFALLIGGDRRAAVLHPGLHRIRRPRPPGTSSAIPRDRSSSTRSGCTSRGSHRSTWATRPRWRGCCSWPRWGCTALLIKGSNRWVHYQGGMR
jgi:multiple sugar transport system permease protein